MFFLVSCVISSVSFVAVGSRCYLGGYETGLGDACWATVWHLHGSADSYWWLRCYMLSDNREGAQGTGYESLPS